MSDPTSGPVIFGKSADGLQVAISAGDYNRFMLGKPRTGTRCDCGGPDAVRRAAEGGMLTTPVPGQAYECFHPTFVGVFAKDLPGSLTTLTAPAPRYDAIRQREVPPPKVVKEWPATCPRCGKAESAVILFSSVECRHGCFKRGEA